MITFRHEGIDYINWDVSNPEAYKKLAGLVGEENLRAYMARTEPMTFQRAQALTTARILGLTVSVADEAEAQKTVLTTAGIEPASTDKRPWSAGEYVGKDTVRTHESTDYRCIQAHVTQGGWMPDATPALWTAVKEDFAPWVQPMGAHDAYDMGAKVAHGGKRWESTAAGNVWEPGVYGWSEVVG